MKTTTKKPVVKKTKVETKVNTTTKPEAKKVEVKSTTKPVKTETKSVNVSSELSKIGAAYAAALNGKMKFSEVKEMLRKLHKEVKKSSKK